MNVLRTPVAREPVLMSLVPMCALALMATHQTLEMFVLIQMNVKGTLVGKECVLTSQEVILVLALMATFSVTNTVQLCVQW